MCGRVLNTPPPEHEGVETDNNEPLEKASRRCFVKKLFFKIWQS